MDLNLATTYLLRSEAGLEQPRCSLEAIGLHGLGAVLLHSMEGLLEALELGVAVWVVGHALLLLIQRFPAQQLFSNSLLGLLVVFIIFSL